MDGTKLPISPRPAAPRDDIRKVSFPALFEPCGDGGGKARGECGQGAGQGQDVRGRKGTEQEGRKEGKEKLLTIKCDSLVPFSQLFLRYIVFNNSYIISIV